MSFKNRHILSVESSEEVILTETEDTTPESIDAIEEIKEIETDIEQDRASLEEAESVIEELTEQVNDNEQLLEQHPEAITDDIVGMSQEAYYNAIGRLGFKVDDAKVSLENADNPIAKFRLSTEGIMDFITDLINKIKVIISNLIRNIKLFIARLTIGLGSAKKVFKAYYLMYSDFPAMGEYILKVVKQNEAGILEAYKKHIPSVFFTGNVSYDKVPRVSQIALGLESWVEKYSNTTIKFISYKDADEKDTAGKEKINNTAWELAEDLNKIYKIFSAPVKDIAMTEVSDGKKDIPVGIYSIHPNHLKYIKVTPTGDDYGISLGTYEASASNIKQKLDMSQVLNAIKKDPGLLRHDVEKFPDDLKRANSLLTKIEYAINAISKLEKQGLKAPSNQFEPYHGKNIISGNQAKTIAVFLRSYRTISSRVYTDLIIDRYKLIKGYSLVFKEIMKLINTEDQEFKDILSAAKGSTKVIKTIFYILMPWTIITGGVGERK